MTPKKIWIILSIVSVTILLSAAIYADSPVPKEQIKTGFDKVKEQVNQQKLFKDTTGIEIPLVKGEGFQISAKDFSFYKGNLELLYKLDKKPLRLDDSNLIDEMVKKELLVKRAEKLGMTVSKQEVDSVIEKERNAFNDPAISGKNNDTVKEIMKNRIRITGFSDDEFWNSEDIRKQYEKSIIIGKLYDHLISTKEIKDMQDFLQYQNTLLLTEKGKYSIHTSTIK